jgi:hypothetical protein
MTVVYRKFSDPAGQPSIHVKHSVTRIDGDRQQGLTDGDALQPDVCSYASMHQYIIIPTKSPENPHCPKTVGQEGEKVSSTRLPRSSELVPSL